MNATTARTAAMASRPEEASISGTLATLPDTAPPCDGATTELNPAVSSGRLECPPMANTVEAEIVKNAAEVSECDTIFDRFKMFMYFFPVYNAPSNPERQIRAALGCDPKLIALTPTTYARLQAKFNKKPQFSHVYYWLPWKQWRCIVQNVVNEVLLPHFHSLNTPVITFRLWVIDSRIRSSHPHLPRPTRPAPLVPP